MRILVIGSGAREHALVRALAADPMVDTVIAAPGNPGIGLVAHLEPLPDPTNAAQVLDVARCTEADLVIGAVLVAGGRAPVVVTKEMVSGMRTGSVIVDVAIDQGGCVETIRETTHSDPTYVVDGVVHYAVGNIPGAVPHTSTYALTNATLPYVVALADRGLDAATAADPALAAGVNVHAGEVTNAGVAAALGMPLAASATLG